MDERFCVTVEVIIRPCRYEDLSRLEWCGEWRADRPLMEQVCRGQAAGEQGLLVAEANGFLVGQVWVDLAVRRAESIGELWALRVWEPFQNLGIGTRLIAAAERSLAARGFAVAEIGVEKDNPRARRLYERLGYRVVAERLLAADHVTSDGRQVREVLDEWVLHKRIAGPEGGRVCSGSI